jgi:phenylpropionate dioxygenase-like ring-hydroxylating dioxygenase large terminal subunit
MTQLEQFIERELDNSIRDDVDAGSFLVHRGVFTNPHIFALEQDRVFNHSWLYVGHESELREPGAFQTRQIAGRSLIVTRSDDGQVRVLLNVCTHRGTPVCLEEKGVAKFFRCPYHAWTFNTRGALTAVPLEDAYGPGGLDREAHALKQPAKVDIYRGFIFVSFDPTIVPLVEYLAGAKEYLDYVCDQGENGMEVLPGTHKYSYRANWKLILENSVDNYHFVVLHHRQVLAMKEVGVELASYGALNEISHGKSLGNGHGVTQHQQIASFGRLAGKWGGNLPAELKPHIESNRASLERRVGPERARIIAESNRNTRFFPNLYVLDHISPIIRLITPISVDYTEIQEWALAPKGEDPAMRAMRLRNNHLQVGPAGFIAPDDVECLERTQRSLGTPEMEWCNNSRGMKERRALSSDELQMRGMHRHWHKLMTLGRHTHPVDV